MFLLHTHIEDTVWVCSNRNFWKTKSKSELVPPIDFWNVTCMGERRFINLQRDITCCNHSNDTFTGSSASNRWSLIYGFVSPSSYRRVNRFYNIWDYFYCWMHGKIVLLGQPVDFNQDNSLCFYVPHPGNGLEIQNVVCGIFRTILRLRIFKGTEEHGLSCNDLTKHVIHFKKVTT